MLLSLSGHAVFNRSTRGVARCSSPIHGARTLTTSESVKLWLGRAEFPSDPLFMARFARRKERIVNAPRSALERKDERSRDAPHKSETPVRVHRAQPDPEPVAHSDACA